MRIPEQWIEVFDGYSPAELSQLMVQALASMSPCMELGASIVSVVRPANPISGVVCRLFVRETQIQILFPEKNDDFRAVVKSLGYEWCAPYWLKSVEHVVKVDRAAELAHRLLLAGFCVQIESSAVKDKAISAKYEPESYRKVSAGTEKPWDGWFKITWPRGEDLFDDVKQITASKWSSGAMYVPPEMYREVIDFAEINGFWLTPDAEMLIQQAKRAWEQVLIVCPQEHKKRQQRKAKREEIKSHDIPTELMDMDDE